MFLKYRIEEITMRPTNAKQQQFECGVREHRVTVCQQQNENWWLQLKYLWMALYDKLELWADYISLLINPSVEGTYSLVIRTISSSVNL